MSDSEEEDILYLQIAALLKFNRKKKKLKKRKYWVREIFRKGDQNGAFNNLVREMKLGDLLERQIMSWRF